MEGMLPGISSFQPRDMSFSGVNADTFSASIFTETFSLPSSKTEEMHIGITLGIHAPYVLSILYTSDVTTSQLSPGANITWHHHLLRKFPQLSSVQPNGMVLSCSQLATFFSHNFHTFSPFPPVLPQFRFTSIKAPELWFFDGSPTKALGFGVQWDSP